MAGESTTYTPAQMVVVVSHFGCFSLLTLTLTKLLCYLFCCCGNEEIDLVVLCDGKGKGKVCMIEILYVLRQPTCHKSVSP
jgi:hypothetical protein